MDKQLQSIADIIGTAGISPIDAEGNLAPNVDEVIGKSPVPSSLPEVHPLTISESMHIIQPKTLTFARYDLTPVQDDMLTMIADELQKYASNEASLIRPDLFGQLSVVLDLGDFPAFANNKKKFVLAIDQLRHKDFEFSWGTQFFASSDGQPMFEEDAEVSTVGNIIATRHDIKRSPKVAVVINPWCIPYLLYYGKGIGGTKYDKNIALSLRHKYSKRIYKWMMDWHTMADSKDVPIEDLRFYLQLPPSYDVHKIRTTILDPAKSDIASSGSHITFDYELLTLHPSHSGKPASDTIRFKFQGHHRRLQVQTKEYQIMLTLLKDIVDPGREFLCDQAAKKIIEKKLFDKILSKFKYYNANADRSKYKTTMLKIIFDEVGTELRSPDHITNSKKWQRKQGR